MKPLNYIQIDTEQLYKTKKKTVDYRYSITDTGNSTTDI